MLAPRAHAMARWQGDDASTLFSLIDKVLGASDDRKLQLGQGLQSRLDGLAPRGGAWNTSGPLWMYSLPCVDNRQTVSSQPGTCFLPDEDGHAQEVLAGGPGHERHLLGSHQAPHLAAAKHSSDKKSDRWRSTWQPAIQEGCHEPCEPAGWAAVTNPTTDQPSRDVPVEQGQEEADGPLKEVWLQEAQNSLHLVEETQATTHADVADSAAQELLTGLPADEWEEDMLLHFDALGSEAEEDDFIGLSPEAARVRAAPQRRSAAGHSTRAPAAAAVAAAAAQKDLLESLHRASMRHQEGLWAMDEQAQVDRPLPASSGSSGDDWAAAVAWPDAVLSSLGADEGLQEFQGMDASWLWQDEPDSDALATVTAMRMLATPYRCTKDGQGEVSVGAASAAQRRCLY